MTIYRAVEFQGMVVSRRDYKERDMLVTMYTDRFGYRTFYVRGAHKRGFRLAAAILPFTWGTYVGNVNDDGLSYINAAKNLQQWVGLYQDIMLNAYGTYLLELTQHAVRGDLALAQQWFPRIRRALAMIDDGLDPQVVTNIVEVQLWRCFGVMPHLTDCVVCHEQTPPFDFSLEMGGLLCRRHWSRDSQRLRLDAHTIYFLRQFTVLNLERVNQIDIRPATKRNLQLVIDRVYDHYVDLQLRSREFLRKMMVAPDLQVRRRDSNSDNKK